nr:MAG TPA: hypothetical protein [Caudoviricetes sp.]
MSSRKHYRDKECTFCVVRNPLFNLTKGLHVTSELNDYNFVLYSIKNYKNG